MRSVRLLVAAVLLFVGELPCFAQTPVPAEYLPRPCKNAYTQQQEIQLGDKVVAEVYKQMPVLPDSDPAAQYVRQLGARLVAAAPLSPGLEQQWPFNFHVVASSEINAFALPGGSMFVNLGAIQAAQTEAQLAGVMGHEMSHVIVRHSTCNLVKQQQRNILYTLGQIGAAVALGGSGGNLAAQGIGAVRSLNFLHMSRDDEKQADMLGVQILHNANFDPRGLPQFFEIIIAKAGQGPAQFLSDHPSPGNRMAYLQQEIAGMPPLSNPVVTSAAFKQAHELAATERVLTDKEIQSGAWKSTGLYASAPGGAPVPVSAGARSPVGSADPGSSAAATRMAPLGNAQLGVTAKLARYQAPLFSISRPASWTASNAGVSAGLHSAVTLAPPGGVGSFGVAYGVVMGVQQSTRGLADTAAMQQASDQLAASFAQTHGLTPEGPGSSTTVAGQPATTRYLTGASPVNGGAERDWLVMVGRPDGDLDVLLFVAPAAQQADLQPLFNRMLATFSPQ